VIEATGMVADEGWGTRENSESKTVKSG